MRSWEVIDTFFVIIQTAYKHGHECQSSAHTHFNLIHTYNHRQASAHHASDPVDNDLIRTEPEQHIFPAKDCCKTELRTEFHWVIGIQCARTSVVLEYRNTR